MSGSRPHKNGKGSHAQARAQLDVDNSKIASPIAGKISRSLITEGNLVNANITPLTTIVSVDPMQVYFNVDERTILTLKAKAGEPPQGNTTLTVMVTNQRFERTVLRQIGRQVHSAMARAIQPFHGRNDGDVLYAVSTFEVDNPRVSDFTLAAVAGELAWDAVLNSYEPG